MAPADSNAERRDGPQQPQTETAAERRRRIRGRNLAMLAVLLGLVALFYVITLVRMGGN